jgi:ribosomal protein S3AE
MAQAKRKKRFFEVDVPIIRKETHLQAYEPEEIDGKTIKYDLTRLLKGKNVILYLKVKKEDNKFVAYPTKMETIHSSLSRIVRRGTDYVEDSFLIDCKDYQLKIKPFLITRRKVHKSIRKALRNKAREELINEMKDKNAETIFEDLIKNQIQKNLSLKLKKIYPLSACEIRILEVKKPIVSESKTE